MSVDGSVSEPLSCGAGVINAAAALAHLLVLVLLRHEWTFVRVHKVVHSGHHPTVPQPVQAFGFGPASLADIEPVWKFLHHLCSSFLDVRAGLAPRLLANDHVDLIFWDRAQLHDFFFKCFDLRLQQMAL